MSFQVFFPQNQAFVESCGDAYGSAADKQLYNGPFTLTSWKMEDQFTMEKNPNYWDAANVKLNKINTTKEFYDYLISIISYYSLKYNIYEKVN